MLSATEWKVRSMIMAEGVGRGGRGFTGGYTPGPEIEMVK